METTRIVATTQTSRKFNETYFITSGTKRKRKRNEITETKSFPRKMHILLWGFLVLALIELNMAASSDKVKNDGREANKSQLDMILAKLQRQQDEQKKEQQLMNEVLREEQLVNEVLRDQIQEQKHKNDEQEREMKEQRRKNDKHEREIKEQRHNNNKLQEEIKELTKINRARRSENETQHLLELIRAEINHVAGLTQCEMGTTSTNSFPSTPTTISFERKFTRKPNVVVAVAGFSGGITGSFKLLVKSITTTKFEMYGYKYSSGSFGWVDGTWIACA